MNSVIKFYYKQFVNNDKNIFIIALDENYDSWLKITSIGGILKFESKSIVII